VTPTCPALIVLAVATGLRRSEMARISVEDIRLQESFLFITKTKSGKPRPVHLPPAAVAELSAHPSIGQESGRLFSFHIGSGLYRPLHDAYAAAGDRPRRPAAAHPAAHLRTWMRRYGKIDETGMLQTGAWANPKSVRRYVHSVVSEEARKADMLPISGVFGDKKLKSLK
jgi:integrase